MSLVRGIKEQRRGLRLRWDFYLGRDSYLFIFNSMICCNLREISSSFFLLFGFVSFNLFLPLILVCIFGRISIVCIIELVSNRLVFPGVWVAVFFPFYHFMSTKFACVRSRERQEIYV